VRKSTGHRAQSTEKKLKIAAAIGVILTLLIAAAVIFAKTAYVVPILMYHSIDYNYKATKLSVSPESFARQMEFLHKNHYNVIRLEKIIPYVTRKAKVPPNTVAITFDDGYYNNYQYAYPVLKKYGIPATIFLIVDRIGKPGYMGWKELNEMAGSGLITMGSHTLSHRWLPSLGTKELEKELAGSKKVLEEKLGKKVRTLCYPIGAFNDRVERFVKQAGYSCAMATSPGRSHPSDDIYAVKRTKISRTSDNLFVFWVETSGFYTLIKENRDSE